MIKATSVATDDGLSINTELDGTVETLTAEAVVVLAHLLQDQFDYVPKGSPEALLTLTITLAVSRIEKFDKEIFLSLLSNALREKDKEEKQNEAFGRF